MKIRNYVFVATAALAAAPGTLRRVGVDHDHDRGHQLLQPGSATLDLGDGSFDWEWAPGGAGTVEPHNVVQDDGLFSSGEPVGADPDGCSVTASAGGYPYFCRSTLEWRATSKSGRCSGRRTPGGGRFP